MFVVEVPVKRIAVALLLAFATAFAAAGVWAADVQALAIVPGAYGANLYLNLDDFENFGWQVTLAGTTAMVQPCPAYGGPLGCPVLPVDLLITEIADVTAYDVVAIMPASQWVAEPYGDLLNSPQALQLLVDAVESGVVVYAPCAGVRVLAAADVLEGVDVNGHANFQAEYEAAGANYLGSGILPVIDGNIVTATRGLYFHENACEAVAIALETLRAQPMTRGAER